MSEFEELSKKDPEEIRECIERTRSGLIAKLETLETEVKHEVKEARSFMQNKVDNVKDAFDINKQIRARPLASVGGGFLLGLLLGNNFFRNSDREAEQSSFTHREDARVTNLRPASSEQYRHRERKVPGAGMAASLVDYFGPELNQLKSITLGALISPVRDAAKSAVSPKLASKLDNVFDTMIEKI